MDKNLFREIMKFAVEKAREITDRQKALEVKYLYKEFDKQIGKVLTVGEYVQYENKLYEVIQEHTVQESWTPDVSKSLFVVIDKEHTGTIDDPIPAQENMIYYQDKYYIENEKLYLCIRDSGIALQYLPSALVGNYFEVVGEETDEPVEENPPTENEEEIIPPIEEDEENPPTENEGVVDTPVEEDEPIEEPTDDIILIENYASGVNYEEGKKYLVNGVVYLCIRSGLLYHDPSALIGNYFELA